MPSLPGFRDFYPEDFARQAYLLSSWRQTAQRYGFVEYAGPTLESLALYEKKNESGAEILQQLYNFTDKGERQVALRPEMTPTLARMVMARERHYRKPLKWFSIASFFRYERQQKGRLREFVQLNADLFGDASPAGEAEVVSLAIDVLRDLGLGVEHFRVRLSDRRAWVRFLLSRGCALDRVPGVLQVIDKLDRESEEGLNAKLRACFLEDVEGKGEGEGALTVQDLRDFIATGSPEDFQGVFEHLEARGLAEFVEVDLSIVRGLAYYTGLVFECFDRRQAHRALAGGGRYDQLLEDLSEGAVRLPALGFGLGDVVLANLIDEVPQARQRLEWALTAESRIQVYVVLGDEMLRREATGLVQRLREGGWRTDFPLEPLKLNKQFQVAESLGAQVVLRVDAQWPLVRGKVMARCEGIEGARVQEVWVPEDEVLAWVKECLAVKGDVLEDGLPCS